MEGWVDPDIGCDLMSFRRWWVIASFIVWLYSLLHNPHLYRRVHKIHHEWTAPVGVTSIYAHPIEHVFSNMLPPVLGPLLMGSHFATALLFFILALISTTISHCGYHFPFLPSPEAHDFHHQKWVASSCIQFLCIYYIVRLPVLSNGRPCVFAIVYLTSCMVGHCIDAI